MSADLATTIRSAPGWLLALIAVTLVLLLVAAGPLAGLAIKRRREAEMAGLLERPGLQRSHGQWIETGEIDLRSLREEERRRDQQDRFSTEIRRDGPVYVAVVEPEGSRVQVIRDNSVTSIITPVPPKILEQESKPSWAGEETREWSMAELTEEVYDAEVVPETSEEEAQFAADPLGSWLLPPAREFDYLPTANEAVSFLIRADLLTGEGLDIDTEWAAWNLYADDKEESNA